MCRGRIANILDKVELPGSRKRRRPQRSFIDVVKEDLQSVCVMEKDVRDRVR